jgi:nickel/cobalt exporter
MYRSARLLVTALLGAIGAGAVYGHEIPNARIDRSIQVELTSRRLSVEYEVSLSELTLTQDLRSLVGSLPGANRGEWFEHYGDVVGPLNARGVLVTIDGEPVELTCRGFDLVVEDHPRYTFHLEAPIPERGRLRLIDSNYASSEGTSRLAIRGGDDVEIEGDSLPTDVQRIPIRPVWELSKDEEARTKWVVVEYRPRKSVASSPAPPIPMPVAPSMPRASGLSALLDRAGASSTFLLALIAYVLGSLHSLQPGHGKALVVAATLGPGGSKWRGAATGLAAAVGHLTTVLILAGVVWVTGASRYAAWNNLIIHVTGFWLATVGLWRVGHFLAMSTPTIPNEEFVGRDHSATEYLGIGLAAGLIPCWDAVALLVVSIAIGRFGLGLFLLVAFSLGMGSVLAGLGTLTATFQSRVAIGSRWTKRLEIMGGCLLAIIGAVFLTSSIDRLR